MTQKKKVKSGNDLFIKENGQVVTHLKFWIKIFLNLNLFSNIHCFALETVYGMNSLLIINTTEGPLV